MLRKTGAKIEEHRSALLQQKLINVAKLRIKIKNNFQNSIKFQKHVKTYPCHTRYKVSLTFFYMK